MFAWMVATALAGNVLLNGQPIPQSAITQVDLRGVDVRVDEQGTIHITAPHWGWNGANIVYVEEPVQASVLGAGGWWLLIEGTTAQNQQIVVRMNNKPIKTFTAGTTARLVPVDSIVRPGANEIEVQFSGDGVGEFAITLGRGRVEDKIPRFEGSPTRFVVARDGTGRPITLRFETPYVLPR